MEDIKQEIDMYVYICSECGSKCCLETRIERDPGSCPINGESCNWDLVDSKE